MKLLKSNWLMGTLIALSLGGTYTTVGLTKEHGKGFGGGHFGANFKELNLTADQKAKLKKLREESKKEKNEDSAKMKEEGKAFREKMAGTASDDELRKDFEKLQSKRAEMGKERFEHMLKVRAILTPEQRKKFADAMEKKMKQHKGKRGKGVEDDENDEE